MPGSGDGSQRCPDASEEEEEEEEVEEEEVERCPICLGVLPGAGLAMPDSCTHLFCLECLLTWAESQTVPSCPVDRQPFHNVYMWDHPQGCVQVPVRKRASQPESERCLCRSPDPSLCLKSKQGRRVRRPSSESDGKTKGLVRKCSDEDPSSMNRKKVRGTRCPVWAAAQLAPVQGSLSQDLTEPLWVTEELARGPEGGQCKRQLQDCPWLGSAALIPATGPTRQRLPASNWNQCPFQSSPATFDFSSATSFGPGHFVFQGRVCAVTCPKGGDKRGGRASGSKAPPKQAAPSRRSGRNSRAQEEAPVSDPGSSPPSPPRPADSDSSSSGAPAPPGRTAQAPGKRKGRKAPNRKAGKKGKGPGKGKASAPVLSTPSASEEEEEEEDEGGNQEEEEKEGDADVSSPPGPTGHSESEHSDGEGSPEMRPLPSPGSPELPSNDVETPDEREEQASPPGEKEEEEPEEMENEEEEEEEGQPLPASSPPHSPDVFSRDDQQKEDQEDEEEDEEVPVCSPGSEGAEDSSPQGGRKARLPSGSPSASPGSPPSPGSDSDGQDQTDAADVKRETPTDKDLKGACDPSPAGDSAPETAGPMGGASGEKTPEDVPSDDDTNVVPMDCSSPGSQPADDPPAKTAGADSKERSSSPGGADQRAGEREKERERSQDRKNGRQRRTRFHSPTSTWSAKSNVSPKTSWSPKREGRPDPSSRRSRSPAPDGSPPSRRSSRPRSRDRERDRERDQPRRDRSRERKRRRSRTRSRSRSKSRSRSRSRSRTRTHRRGSSPDRPASRERSPQRGGRGGTGWRGGRGGDSWRSQGGGGGNSENGSVSYASPERSNPDWVAEQRGAATGAAPWGGDSGWRGASERGRGGGGGGGQGGCNRSFSGQQGETADGRWGRKNFPGAGNGAGSDAYSRFNENRGGGGPAEGHGLGRLHAGPLGLVVGLQLGREEDPPRGRPGLLLQEGPGRRWRRRCRRRRVEPHG